MSTSANPLPPTTTGEPVHLAADDARAWAWTRTPVDWSDDGSGVTWRCPPHSDYWRITEGVPSAYDGSALLTALDGDFTVEARLSATFSGLYDQVGLLIAASETHWLKVGVEIDGDHWLSAVHTREESDWSRERWHEPTVTLRVVRRAGTIDVSIDDDGEWRIFRTLHFAGPVGVGPYSCAPKSDGFESTVRELTITTG